MFIYVYCIFLFILLQKSVCEKFIVVKEPANWFQALINCKNTGMELASIGSEEESKALEKYMKENGHISGYWIAGTNLGNGDYYWATTGMKAIYTNWLPKQPDTSQMNHNDYEGEHCIELKIFSSPLPSGWNDLSCEGKLPYICQKDDICYSDDNIIKFL